MADRQVDSEALATAAKALGDYIKAVQGNIHKMKDAATDCSDNMGSDVYSKKAIEKLQVCTKELSRTMEQAAALQKAILQKKRDIEDSLKKF